MRRKWNDARAARGAPRQTLSNHLFSVWPVILLLGLVWPFGSGKKVEMMAGTDAPAAHGTVILKQGGDNENRQIEVKTSSLARPDSLKPPENAYVVWLQEPGHEPQNVGQLKVDDKGNGDLQTVTAFRRFKLFITAEENAQAHEPEGTQVLSADIASVA